MFLGGVARWSAGCLAGVVSALVAYALLRAIHKETATVIRGLE